MDDKLIYKEEAYRIVGLCMEVHGILGKGHSEVVYKDALEYEFSNNQIPFSREKIYKVNYKDIVLPRGYTHLKIVFGENPKTILPPSDQVFRAGEYNCNQDLVFSRPAIRPFGRGKAKNQTGFSI